MMTVYFVYSISSGLAEPHKWPSEQYELPI
jgi:hypothetical protein